MAAGRTRWKCQYLRQLAPCINLPLSCYLADILGFDPEQAIKRPRPVRPVPSHPGLQSGLTSAVSRLRRGAPRKRGAYPQRLKDAHGAQRWAGWNIS